MKRLKTDLVIVGAGLTGLSAALKFSDLGFKVMLVDKKAIQSLKTETLSARALALRPQSQQFLNELKIWGKLVRQTPVEEIVVYDNQSQRKVHFSEADSVYSTALAHIVEQPILFNALLERVLKTDSIEFLISSTIESIHAMPDKVQLDLGDQLIDAQLLIAADGQDSAVRQTLGWSMWQKDYQQKALVCRLKLAAPHENVARQWFGTMGPLAFLPLSEPDQVSIVWSLNELDFSNIFELSDEDLLTRLTDYADPAFAPIQIESPRFSFPLQNKQAQQYCADRIVLLGESAHVIHPLAGQGFNLAVADLMSLAKHIQQAQNHQHAFYAKKILRAYERERKCENVFMGHAMTVLDYLFKSERLSMLRRGALGVIEQWPSMKKVMVNRVASSS